MFDIGSNFGIFSSFSWHCQELEIFQKDIKHGSKGMSMHYSLNLQK